MKIKPIGLCGSYTAPILKVSIESVSVKQPSNIEVQSNLLQRDAACNTTLINPTMSHDET
jgi:hypothetical protein